MHRTPDTAGTFSAPRSNAVPWWRNATVYRLFLPSFADGNADGIGDLVGLRDRLGYLLLLGIDAVSLGGLLTESSGHDEAEVPGIDRTVGTLADLDAFIPAAHEQGLKVTLETSAVSGIGVERALRFWLDRGVDGFRVAGGDDNRLRRLLDSYPGRVLAGSGDGFGPQQRLQDGLCRAGWDAARLTKAINDALAVVADTDSVATWMLSDRGLGRPGNRYASGSVGLQRARAIALLQLALPGAVELWSGDELGLPDVVSRAPELVESGVGPHTYAGSSDGGSWSSPDTESLNGQTSADRSGETSAEHPVPLPWAGEKPPYEFTARDASWLPIPEGWADLTVENQLEDTGSMLSLYRQALEIRHGHPSASGDAVEWYGAPDGCMAFRRSGGLICAVNTSDAPVPLPPGEPVLSSGPLVDDALPRDTTAWLL